MMKCVKRGQILWSIMLAVLMIFSLVGCGSKEHFGLQAGFTTGSDEPAPPINVAFMTEKSQIKIGEDLVVEVYCQPQNDYTQSGALKHTAELFVRRGNFHNGVQNPQPTEEDILLRQIADFWSEEYRWEVDAQGKFVGKKEVVIIPAEWFSDEIGAFSWIVLSQVTFSADSPEREIRESGSIALYYRLDGENVILYATFYDFVNDIR